MITFVVSKQPRNVSKHLKVIFSRIPLKRIVFSHSEGGKKKILPTYSTPHPPKDPPEDYQPICVDHNAFTVPDFLSAAIFRPFKCPEEILGPSAHKDGCYKNPEYYAYHRYSFATIQLCALAIREERIQSGGIRCIHNNESDCDGESDSSNDDTVDKCG